MFYVYYLSLYFAMGVLYTFLSVFFVQHTPLTPEQVTRLLSLAPIISFLSDNSFAYLSDKTRKYKTVLMAVILATITSAVLVALLTKQDNYYLLIIAYFIFALFYPSIASLSENFTIEQAKIKQIPYGRIRLFGSLGYAIAGQVAGTITGIYGLPIIFYVVALFSLLQFFIVPRFADITIAEKKEEHATEAEQSDKKKVYSTLFRNNNFLLIMLLSFLIIGSLNVTGTIFGLFITQDAKLPLSFLGTMSLVAAAAEIPMMYYANKLIDKFGVYTILALAAALNSVRFITYFFFPTQWPITLVTVTHGIGFGSAFTALMHLIEKQIPASMRATAISFNGSLAMGIGSFAITFLSSLVLSTKETFVLLSILQATAACICIYIVFRHPYIKSAAQ